jgi:hypothetical protein
MRRSIAIEVLFLLLVPVAVTACGGDDDGEPQRVPFELECEDPVAIMQPGSDQESGFVTCGDGFVHRAEAVTCVIPEAPETCSNPGGPTDTCTTSAECDDRPNGACLDDPSQVEGCGCVYGCETDADCAQGEVCACAGPAQDWPRCVPAGCRSDADCDGLCGFSVAEDGCGGPSYELACLDEASECRVTCSEEEGCYENVEVPPCEVVSGEWTCNVEDLCEDCG